MTKTSKICTKCKKEYYNKNKELIKIKNREYNKKVNYKNQKKYYENNRDYYDNYYKNNKEEVLRRNKEWRNNNKDKVRSYLSKYYHDEHGIIVGATCVDCGNFIISNNANRLYCSKCNSLHSIKKYRKYRKNNKDKIKILKAKRERNLKWIKLSENPFIEEDCDWHHIDNEFVVAIPRDLHELYKFGNENIKHRFMVNQIVEQVYHNSGD